jgi:hypothetical protein
VQWLKPVILATWEVYFRRITVPSKKFPRPHFNQWLGTVVHLSTPATQQSINKKVIVQVILGIETLSQK